MITLEEARKLAQSKINDFEKQLKFSLLIRDEQTISFEFGWMFFYQSEEYIKTGNILYMLGGNSPLIVDKFKNILIETGTGKDSKFYIEKYSLYRDDISKFEEELLK